MRIAERLGEVGLPEPVSALAGRAWDVIVVGGGHNGLTCAAYLARAGLSVLVLERRERLGGACTLERPFAHDPRYVVSPCAYVVGLLDPLVVSELELERRGLEVYLADPNLWIPFEDGSAFGQWLDPRRTQADLERLGLSQADIDGYWRYGELFAECRRRLREGPRDTWVGEAPSRAELEALLGDRHLVDVVFEASIADVLDEHIRDQRLKDALWTQGVIGTYAGPKDPGTASIHLMHYSGRLRGHPGTWGYVKGGMGVVSFTLAEAAQEAGAVLACGVPVGEVVPEEGVRLEDGTVIRARGVVCNADPKVVLALLDGQPVPGSLRERLAGWDTESPVLKLNAALRRLPGWTAAGGDDFPARGTVDVSNGLEAGQAAVEACRRGEARVAFAEVYVQTLLDETPAPPGKHSLSVFAQYAPYSLAHGSWDSEREAIARQVIDLVARFAPDFDECLEAYELLGPPDLEARVGLSGGHIFQGDCRPGQMWDRRLRPRTEVPGFYLCGAATHPAGSVVALNGRNAAQAVLADLTPPARPAAAP